jgi:hypothetical protein
MNFIYVLNTQDKVREEQMHSEGADVMAQNLGIYSAEIQFVCQCTDVSLFP